MGQAPAPAVVGVADHSGWANLVTVGVVGGALAVVDRRRCELVGPDVARQPYHAADGLTLDEAEALVADVTAAALDGARREIAALAGDLRDDHRLVAMAMRAGAARPVPDSVAGVLASHGAMHAAEGALYRDALAEAAAVLGIPVIAHPRGDVVGPSAAALGTSVERVQAIVAELGRAVGPPWQKEHREAVAAVLGELARHTTVAVDP